MKKLAKKRPQRQGIKKTRMKQEAKHKNPDLIKPILYTRRLKSRKQKKIKQIAPPLRSDALDSKFDDDPFDDDEQKAPSSFRDMMRRINDIKGHRNPYRYSSNEGDTKGMRSEPPDIIPKQGEKETAKSYARRLNRCVQDELVKITVAKKDKAPLVDPETYKSTKTRKALKRLTAKKEMKKVFRIEKNLTGFEHLKDSVKFGEVVQGPPVLKTKPKKVGGGSTSNDLTLTVGRRVRPT
ncbi:peptidase [Echinococcus multilocularis]|uniref:Peptidase n=1 Tax=Echinococcus multilocularis TaxID=6211 RepID=A0A068YHX0_ECHMU|nr:peptidase [Echinococcus multilocularis]